MVVKFVVDPEEQVDQADQVGQVDQADQVGQADQADLGDYF